MGDQGGVAGGTRVGIEAGPEEEDQEDDAEEKEGISFLFLLFLLFVPPSPARPPFAPRPPPDAPFHNFFELAFVCHLAPLPASLAPRLAAGPSGRGC